MNERELGRFARTYSELEGLQAGSTVYYRALAAPQGAVLELRQTPGRRCAVLCPGLEEGAAGALLRYLYENGVAPGQLAEVLADLGRPFRPADGAGPAAQSGAFCGICQF